MIKNLAAALLLAAFSHSARADGTLRWSPAKNEIPPASISGTVMKADGVVKRRDGASFAVPAEAFADQRNFTVQITLSIDELAQDAVFTARRKQTEQDDEFALFFNYRDKPSYARQVMKEEGIELIDIYTKLAARLDLAAGDNFHWQAPAYQMITQEIAQRIAPTLKKKP